MDVAVPPLKEDRGIGAAHAMSQIMKEILELVNWFAQQRVQQSIVQQISPVSGPFHVASCDLLAMKFVRQGRARVEIVVEAVDVDVDVACGGMVLAVDLPVRQVFRQERTSECIGKQIADFLVHVPLEIRGTAHFQASSSI